MLWGIVLSFIATGVVADSISLFNPDPGAPISAYSAGVGSPSFACSTDETIITKREMGGNG
jgi:hypothetical protein